MLSLLLLFRQLLLWSPQMHQLLPHLLYLML